MARITIKSDGNGGAVVNGTPPVDNGFFDFALGKVLSGKATEISWEPIVGLLERREERQWMLGKSWWSCFGNMTKCV